MGIFGSSGEGSGAGLFIFGGVMQYVELSRMRSGIKLERCIDMPYEVGSAGGDIFAAQQTIENNLRNLRRSIGKRWPSRICAAIQSKDVLLRTVDLPKMSIDDIKGAFRYEFDRFFPIPVDDAVYDVAFIERAPQEDVTQGAAAYCLASAVRRTTVENFMTAAMKCGLKLKAIEPSPISMVRCLSGPVAPLGYNVFALAGITSSIIVSSFKDNGIVYRNTAQSFATYDEEGTTIADFTRDLQATINFSAAQIRGFSPDKIYIGGWGANDALRQSISRAITSPVDIVNPWKLWEITGTPKDSFGWEISLGLALRSAEVV